MDQGFAPGQTAWEIRMRDVFNRRINTRASRLVGAESIQDFFRDLHSSNVVADDLLVGSHASNEGVLFLDLDARHSGDVSTYEVLDEVASAGTIEIPIGIRKPSTRFHVKGCRIGSDDCRPYLVLLKRALGNRSPVTAPRFFHALYNGSRGHFEYMMHSYEINAKDAFKTHADLISAFQNANFRRLDGTQVEDADIARWVDRRLNLAPRAQQIVPITVPVRIVPRTGDLSAIDNIGAQCRVTPDVYTFIQPGINTQAKLKPALLALDMFKATHPYPFYARNHYATFDDWFNGQTWRFTARSNTWTGTHFVYTLVIPVTKPAKPPDPPNELIFNFYPPTGNPTMNFLETDATLFGQV